MTARPDIVCLIYREGLNSVFLSQMATPAGLLRKSGLPVGMCAFASIGEFVRPLHRSLWKTVRAAAETPIARLPSPPSRARNAWDESKLLTWWIRRHFAPQQRVILDGAGTYATCIALATKRACPNVRVIHRMYGLSHEEFIYESGVDRVADLSPVARRQYDSIADQFDRATRQADAVVCVSDEMVRYATTLFAADPARFAVVPCCVDTERFVRDETARAQLRRSLKLDDRFVVVYCGSFHRWQAPRKAAAIFSQLKAIEPRAHFLVLTTNPDRFADCLRAEGLSDSDLTVRSVPHTAVAKHLAAGDVGLLPREPSVVNSTASPVKFAEYAAAGLPVIISDGVGDYSAAVQRERLGLVLRNDAGPEDARRQLAEFLRALAGGSADLRARCTRFAEEHLSWRACLPTWARVYDKLA